MRKNRGLDNGNWKIWITPADLGKLNSVEVDETPRKITELGLQKSSTKVFPEYSVILSTRAPIGHLAINKVPMSTNQRLLISFVIPMGWHQSRKALPQCGRFFFHFPSLELCSDFGKLKTMYESKKNDE